MADVGSLRQAGDKPLVGGARGDPQHVKDALLPWLRRQLPAAEDISLPLPTAPDLGGSSSTFFLRPSIKQHGQVRQESWVLRIEATDHQVYQFPSIERQFRTMETLGRLGQVPVPETFWFEPDKSILGEAFFIMARVPGTVPLDRYHMEGLFFDATPAQRETMWHSAIEAIAAIHNSDVSAFGFLDRPEFGAAGIAQEIAVWDRYRDWVGPPFAPVQERAHRWLHDNRPPETSACLVWGDARVPNTIYRDGTCVAVLDWETVSLCAPEVDLGWLRFFDWFASAGHYVPRLEGIPDMDATMQIWSGLTGRAPQHLEWFEVFSTWRFGVIRDRAWRLAGIDYPPDLPRPDPFLRRLEELLAELT